MMIMGGGIVSWLQDPVSEVIGIQRSYIVAFCVLPIWFYAWKVSSIL
jgi:fucose permease